MDIIIRFICTTILNLIVLILIINFNICTMKRKVLLSTLFLILHFTVALAQQVTISGQVLDEKSEPLIGATINIEGTTNAVITDLEGKFTIKVLPSEKLVISYLGYKPKTITIGKNRRFDIILDPSVTEMDEVVVVGYGSQRKSDIATAVASVNIKDIVNSSSTQTLQALQGKISGVQIIPTDGSLSSGMTFRIRGVNSVTGGTQPLFVIDGVPMPTQQITNEDTETVNNPLLGLNPNDIESNLNYWNPRPIKKDNPYLTVQRKLSPQTVEDFANRLFIYQVGKNNHIGFPFRKPSQMEILNFEMRNYFAETNTNYKAFATGGDKAQSCWMANFVPFDKVTDIYLFESAIDAMSFYEINHYTKETTCAFISTGGYVTKSQIENIRRIFPSDKVKWNCCYDNDASGNGFDITTAYYLKGEECKAFARTNTGDTYKTIYLSFPDGNTLTFKEDAFSSGEYLKQHGIDNVNIIKPSRYKDWNELLVYYKRFDLNLGPGMKFIPAIEKTISQLNLRGYEQLANCISSSTKELVDSLLEQANYCISAPLAESSAYTLMVDCNIFMGLDTMVPVPSNLYVIEKCTQKKISAHAINESLKNEYINIFRDMKSSDFKNFLEKNILTYTKGTVEKNFEKVILTSGWNIKPSTSKKKILDLEHGI